MMKKISVRKAYGEALADYGAINSNVVVVVADVSASVQTGYFARRFPERFFNVGIAEQGMIDVAVGFALGGMIPFVNTFAALFLRTIEQIRDFKDGPTHHAEADLAMMRDLPNMTVIEAADAVEARKMVPLVAEYDGPVYLRISRAETPVIFDDAHKVEIGKGVIVRDGSDVALISSGVMVSRCLTAAELLANEGIDSQVINMHTIKPLDVSMVQEAARKTGAIVTAEEHSIIGGLGSAVGEVLGERCPVPLERVGISDTFTETALDYESLLDHYGMAVRDIVKAARRAIKRKEGKN